MGPIPLDAAPLLDRRLREARACGAEAEPVVEPERAAADRIGVVGAELEGIDGETADREHVPVDAQQFGEQVRGLAAAV